MQESMFIAVGYNLALLVICLGVGSLILRVARFRFISALEAGIFSLALGYAVVAYGLLAVGLLGKLNAVSALAVLLVGGVLTLTQLPTGLRAAKARWQDPALPQGSVTWLLIGLMVIHAGLNLAGALAPPTDADSLRHHLAAPKFYIRAGGFPFVPIFWWNAPGTLHVLYTSALLLANDIGAQVLHYTLGLLIVLSVYAFCVRYFSPQIGLVSAVIFYSLPTTTYLSTASYVEFGTAVFALLSIYALINAGKSLDSRWVILAGLLGGWAGAIKIWGLLILPAAPVVIGVLQGRTLLRGWRRFVVACALYGLAFGLVLSPWLIRNFLASGDPLWPFGYNIFKGQYWSEWQTQKFANWERGPGLSAWNFLIGPWNLTNNIAAFSPGDGPLTPSLLSPLLLAFIPAAWLFGGNLNHVRGLREIVVLLSAFCLVVYSIWFLGGYQHPRYIQMLHPFLAILAGVGIWNVFRTQHRVLRLTSAGLVTGTFVFTLGIAVVFNASSFRVVLGRESRDEYLSSKVPYCQDLDWVNRHLPPEARVLYLSLQSYYYLDRAFVLGVPAYQGIIQYGQYNTSEELFQELKRLGITHVFFEGLGYNNATDLLSAWAQRPPTYSSEVAYQEWRPIELLAPLVQMGKLKLIYSENSAMIRSRTFGVREPTHIAIYEVDYGQ